MGIKREKRRQKWGKMGVSTEQSMIDNLLKLNRPIQCNPRNDKIIKSFKSIKN